MKLVTPPAPPRRVCVCGDQMCRLTPQAQTPSVERAVMECFIQRHPAGVEVRCGSGDDEITAPLPRLATIRSRCSATVGCTNAAVRFGLTQVVPVDVPCVVTATAFVINPDRIARQHTVLSDASDGSATRAIKLSHPMVSRHILFRQMELLNTALFTPSKGPQARSSWLPQIFVCLRCWNGGQRGAS
jgi:hypothetical protein